MAEVSGLPQAAMVRSMLEAFGLRVEILTSGAGIAYGVTVGALARVHLFVGCAPVQEERRLLAKF